MKLANLFTLAVATLATAEQAGRKPRLTSEKLQKTIKPKKLWSHLEALDNIARTKGNGNRAFGLPGYAASVDYIWSHISNVKGVKAWKQDFKAWFGQVKSISLKIDGQEYYVFGVTYSPSTSEQGITAEMVLGPEGVDGCDPAKYEGLNAKGKIVLVQRFRCPGGTTIGGRVAAASAAGASAVIVYTDADTKPTAGSLGRVDFNTFRPAGLISKADGNALVPRLKAGEKLQAYFKHIQTVEERVTQNVFAETVAGDPKNVIMMGAHLDGVQAGPGINDDGSGTTLIMEVFKGLMKFRHTNKVRFAWWGAEENGLLGSAHYCKNLGLDEANNILTYLNYDMVSRGYYGVSDNDGSQHGSVAPKGSEVIERIFLDWFANQGLETTPAILSNGSDYASFWTYLNKPFGFLHTGTAIQQDACYHQACDTIENPNLETIFNNAKAAAHMLGILAQEGHTLIPKAPMNASMLASQLRSPSVSTTVDIAELQALGERHLGCGHDI